jgi:predicted peptidase
MHAGISAPAVGYGVDDMRELKQHLSTRVTGEVELDYLLYLPKAKEGSPAGGLPLLLFLHGSGERGNDLTLVKRHGPPHVVETGMELPLVVLAPQCPQDSSWHADSLMALVDHIVPRHGIDTKKVYLTGLSMGGYGTWMLAGEYPERFAAIAPVCGPYTSMDPVRFRNTPVWCFHGAMDDVIPVEHSIRMVRRIRDAGGDVRFTVYPDAGHDSWTETYALPALYDWFLTHTKA